jgi:diguanylate cyclase (GGDEF)-like protein
VQLSISLVRDADAVPQHFVAQIQDLTARRRVYGELERLDALTGVLNRRAWDAELAAAVADSGRTGEPFAIALLDFNDFKQVNHSAGHPTGDQVLRRTAEVWGTRLREGDRFARLGGDEFAVLPRGGGAFAAQSIAQRLNVQLQHAPVARRRCVTAARRRRRLADPTRRRTALRRQGAGRGALTGPSSLKTTSPRSVASLNSGSSPASRP